VLHDFVNVLRVEGFKFEETFGDDVELGAMLHD